MTAELQISRNLQSIAGLLDEALQEAVGERVGFVLIVAPFTWQQQKRAHASAVTNINREDAAALIQKCAEAQAGAFDVPLHQRN